MDSIVLAHVADALTEIIDCDSGYRADVDYDAVADEATGLLTRVPALVGVVEQWNAGAVAWDALVARVRAAWQAGNRMIAFAIVSDTASRAAI